MNWYYAKKGQQFGPLSETDLRQMARQGELAPDDLVWTADLGNQWVPAGSLNTLFAGFGTPVVPPSLVGSDQSAASAAGGRTDNDELMRRARASLRTHWGLGVGVMLLAVVLNVAVGFIPVLGIFAGALLNGPLSVGFGLVFLSLVRGSASDVALFFKGFDRFGTALGAYLLITLFTLLWSLLLIVPGIIAGYSYAMTYFVIADDPTVGALEAITRSKQMMRGNKWKLCCLSCRFIGWGLLCVLTCLIGYLWLIPYVQTTVAHFYEDIRPRR